MNIWLKDCGGSNNWRGQEFTVWNTCKGKTTQKETVTTVIDELNERKTRENNLLIFGLKENVSEILQEREGHDIENIL